MDDEGEMRSRQEEDAQAKENSSLLESDTAISPSVA